MKFKGYFCNIFSESIWHSEMQVSLKNKSTNKDSVQAFEVVGRYTENLCLTIFLRDLTATDNGIINWF